MSSPGKDAVIHRKQSWAQPMSSPRVSDLAPVTSRAGSQAPSGCSDSWASPFRRSDEQPGKPRRNEGGSPGTPTGRHRKRDAKPRAGSFGPRLDNVLSSALLSAHGDCDLPMRRKAEASRSAHAREGERHDCAEYDFYR